MYVYFLHANSLLFMHLSFDKGCFMLFYLLCDFYETKFQTGLNACFDKYLEKVKNFCAQQIMIFKYKQMNQQLGISH